MPTDTASLRADAEVAPLVERGFRDAEELGCSSTVHRQSVGSFIGASLLLRLAGLLSRPG